MQNLGSYWDTFATGQGFTWLAMTVQTKLDGCEWGIKKTSSLVSLHGHYVGGSKNGMLTARLKSGF